MHLRLYNKYPEYKYPPDTYVLHCRTVLLTGIFEHYLDSDEGDKPVFYPAAFIFNMYVIPVVEITCMGIVSSLGYL